MNIETVKSLFDEGNACFEVPMYQRAYSWQKEQLTQFVDDLSESECCGYHLGHFLFEQGVNIGDKVVYVIDGQQRLTTCVIFFSALISVLNDRKAEWKEEENIDKYIVEVENRYLRRKNNREQRFRTVEYDENVFSDIIVDRSTKIYKDSFKSRSQRLIYKALCYFKDVFSKISINEIYKLGKTLERARITRCFADNKLQAVQIFSYQNDRGRKLTNLEVLKAYFMLLMYQSGGNENDVKHVERWFEDIYRNIVNITAEEDSVLNYYWKAVGEKGYGSENTISEVKKMDKRCSYR